MNMAIKGRVLIIASALLALFLGALDTLIMSAAMPTIVVDLGGLDLYSWVFSAYLLSRAVSLPIFGKMADLFKTKNLFLCDKKGKRHFLVVVPAQKRVNIKSLSTAIGAGHLSFGSPDRLKRYLTVDPGSVTILALISDPDHAVEVIFDEVLWQAEAFQFHPLVNTSTLLIPRDSLRRFLEATGHEVRLLDVPSQD